MRFALALVFWCALSACAAQAGEVKLVPDGSDFKVSVSVKETSFDTEQPLTAGADGSFSYPFGPETFAKSAYAERIFVITWAPLVADKPAKGVREFSIELPILLRSWRADEVYVVKMPTFTTINGAALTSLEQLSNPGDQWKKFFVSMQQSDHYSHRIRVTSPEAKRSLRTAINGFVAIAGGVKDRWIRLPSGLPEKIRQVFEQDERTMASLSSAVDQADSLVWQELMKIESLMENASCDAAKGALDYLDARRRDNMAAYDRLLGKDSPLLDNIRARFLPRKCAGAVAAG